MFVLVGSFLLYVYIIVGYARAPSRPPSAFVAAAVSASAESRLHSSLWPAFQCATWQGTRPNQAFRRGWCMCFSTCSSVSLIQSDSV